MRSRDGALPLGSSNLDATDETVTAESKSLRPPLTGIPCFLDLPEQGALSFD
jgi:hypothetical protein